MRNYSALTVHSINTVVVYSLERDHFRSAISSDLESKVLPALAMALETPEHVIRNELNLMLCQGLLAVDDYEVSSSMTPAEGRVVANLARFLFLVQADSDDNIGFVYCNINTGSTVVWSYAEV